MEDFERGRSWNAGHVVYSTINSIMGQFDISILGSINVYPIDRRESTKRVYFQLKSVRKVALLLSVSSPTAHRWNHNPKRKPYAPVRNVATSALHNHTYSIIERQPFEYPPRRLSFLGGQTSESPTRVAIDVSRTRLLDQLANRPVPFRQYTPDAWTTWLPSKCL